MKAQQFHCTHCEVIFYVAVDPESSRHINLNRWLPICPECGDNEDVTATKPVHVEVKDPTYYVVLKGLSNEIASSVSAKIFELFHRVATIKEEEETE